MTTKEILTAKRKASYFAERALLVHYNSREKYQIVEAILSLDELAGTLDAARAELVALKNAIAEVEA